MLKDSTPSKLVGRGTTKHFEMKRGISGRGFKLKGLTKRLQSHIFSEGALPSIATQSTPPAGGHWRGLGGGRRRGSAVDSQVSRLASATPGIRNSSKMLNLTKLVFSALSLRGLEPVMGQRAVCSQMHRLGTAADILCYDAENNAVVVVELKCGHGGARTAAAVKSGCACTMKTPLAKAADNTLNRHLAQLAVTHHLLIREVDTVGKMRKMGIQHIYGILMYANDASIDVYELDTWWINKAPKILSKLV